MPVDEVGRVVAVKGFLRLNPVDAVVEEMLSGWRRQQLSRNLSLDTIAQRERCVRRFVDHSQAFPWSWTPGHVDDFFGDLRSRRAVQRSTIRSYQNAVRMFCSYVSNPDYGWDRECERLFGSHPSQVVFDWNAAPHAQSNEQAPTKRAFTKLELQRLFDRADDEVSRIRSFGLKGLLPAWRDAVAMKASYAWGLRHNEVRHLQSVDFSRNPHAPEFGQFGVVQVRYGKAHRSSVFKRRSVMTVFPWAETVMAEWVQEGLPFLSSGLDLFPSGSQGVVNGALGIRFRRYRDELGFSPGLDFHSLRRSYVTHLIEDGFDPLFVQQQVGHEHASTTAIYTCVSSDFRARSLRDALDRIIEPMMERNRDTQ